MKALIKIEAASVTDLMRAQKHISGYLEYLWQNFLDAANVMMRVRLIAFFGEMDVSATGTESGLVYVKNKGDNGELFGGVTGMTNFLTVASGLLLFVNLPVALGAFATSRIVKAVFKKDADAEKLSAFINSALDGCGKLEELIVEKITAAFADFEREAQEKLSSTYKAAEDKINDNLNFAIASSQNARYREKLAELINKASEED
ncbi:MAG: hypothetical protein LBU32_23485 [Clostridiales bacterium]|nr:hypothetical protein [Clostridiales bacterium]